MDIELPFAQLDKKQLEKLKETEQLLNSDGQTGENGEIILLAFRKDRLQ